MTIEAPENKHFVRLVEALRPWLQEIVIIGGWAHRLYRIHPLSQRLEFPPLTTLDTDIAVPKKLTVERDDVHTRLKASGFNEEFLGEHRPPVTHYTLGESGGGFYVEFLTPLTGGTENRGNTTATVIVAGVNSQKLRYLDLLLNAPWHITLESSTGFPVKESTIVRIPNAAAYLAQKLLIHDKREAKERAKDVMYIHDTIQTFGRSLPGLQHEWVENVRKVLSAKEAAKVANSAGEVFAAVTDTVRNAAIEAAATGRSVRPEDVLAVCHSGLKQIFV